MTTMPIMMLGSDFQYAFAPSGRSLGADSSLTIPISSTGINPEDIPVGYRVKVDLTTGAIIKDASGRAMLETVSDTKLSTGESARSIWDEIKSNIPNLITATKDTIIAAIKAKHPGMSDADAATIANQGKGFSLAGSMPWLIIGGVGLVALLFMVGTRKR